MQLAAPPGVAFPMIMTSTGVSEPITSTPVLCGNTSAPTVMYGQVSPLYYSPTGVTSLKPFVFGASSADPTTPASARGASMSFNGSTMRVLGDPALVCYGLDANGVHGPTPDVMRDQFEGVNVSPTWHVPFNSSVALNVFHVPTSATDFYGYTLDVTIPARPANVNCTNVGLQLRAARRRLRHHSRYSTRPPTLPIPRVGAWQAVLVRRVVPARRSPAASISTTRRSTPATACQPSPRPGHLRQLTISSSKRFFRLGVTALPASAGPVAIACAVRAVRLRRELHRRQRRRRLRQFATGGRAD